MKIAVHGPMCSGKTTVSKIIQEYDKQYKVYSFGKKVKDIANDLFQMQHKDRSLLINIASKMREIDEDIWAKYVLSQIKKDNTKKCIIDDLRFKNESKYLHDDWVFISLTTPKNIRIDRIKSLYKENYKDHIKNMNHISENDSPQLPKERTHYIDTSIDYELLKKKIINILQ